MKTARYGKQCLAVLLFFASVFLGRSGSAAELPDEATIRQIVENRVAVAQQTIGLVVGTIDEKGSHIYAFGRLAGNRSTAVTGDTLFELASVTKIFTATLLADMVAKGEVSLHDSVAGILPAGVKVPQRNGKEITLYDLATQSSGLPRLPANLAPKDPENPYADYTIEQLYAFLADYPLPRDIGEKYEYSNLGFALLAHALTRRAGQDYETLVQDRICRPLHLDSTTLHPSPALLPYLAVGHNALLQPVKYWDTGIFAGAGGLRSSANDMLKLIAANLGLVDSPLYTAMLSAQAVQKPTDIAETNIGLGWNLTQKDDLYFVWHNGAHPGFRSFIGFVPAKKYGVVVLSNSGNDIDDIGLHLLHSSSPLHPLHIAISLNPKIYADYIGHYNLAPNLILSITADSSHLFAQLTGQAKFEIFPESEVNFFYKVVDAQITFNRQPDGSVPQLTLHQNGQNMVGPRSQ